MGLQILIKDTILALAEKYKKSKKDFVFSEKDSCFAIVNLL